MTQQSEKQSKERMPQFYIDNLKESSTRDATRSIEVMIRMRRRPTTEEITALMHSYNRSESFDDTLRVFKEPDLKKGPLNTNTYNAVIKAYAHTTPSEATTLFEEMKEQGIQPNADTYAILALMNAHSKHPQQVFDLVTEMEQGDIAPQLPHFASQIRAHIFNGDVDAAFNVIPEIKKHHLNVDTRFFNTAFIKPLIESKSLDLPKFQRIFDSMQQHHVTCDAITWTLALSGIFKKSQLPMGKALHEMIKKWQSESKFGSNVNVELGLIKMYYTCHQLQAGTELFQKFQQRNVTLPEDAWRSRLSATIKLKGLAAGCKLVEEMQKDFKVQVETWKILVDRCRSVQDLDLLRQIQFQLENSFRRIPPDLVVPLVTSYLACQDVNCAKDLMENFGEISQVRTDVSTWNSIVAELVKRSQFEEAVKFVKKMIEFGVQDKDTWLMLMDGKYNSQNLLIAKEIESITLHLYSRDPAVVKAMSDMYDMCQSPSDRDRYLAKVSQDNAVRKNVKSVQDEKSKLKLKMEREKSRMKFLKSVENPNLQDSLALIQLCNSSAELKSIWEHLKPSQMKSPPVWAAVMQSYMKFDLVQEAFDLMMDMPPEISDSPLVWTPLIYTLKSRGNFAEIQECWRSLEQNRIELDSELYFVFLESFILKKDVEQTMETYFKLKSKLKPSQTTLTHLWRLFRNNHHLENCIFMLKDFLEFYPDSYYEEKQELIRKTITLLSRLPSTSFQVENSRTTKNLKEMEKIILKSNGNLETKIPMLHQYLRHELFAEFHRFFDSIQVEERSSEALTPVLLVALERILRKEGIENAEHFIHPRNLGGISQNCRNKLQLKLLEMACQSLAFVEAERIAENFWNFDENSRKPEPYLMLKAMYTELKQSDQLEFLENLMKERHVST
eukprot:TRINITY_DN4677_c1_g5_i1.p1 TRINITY_DN4677_c1_g5~~TRINITY_DN4677_c1_g5_i1.p1  ORF type:complete len:955 (+),score=353.73 TRINITY_DN4677_c1_g5_i1:175-2865(+)